MQLLIILPCLDPASSPGPSSGGYGVKPDPDHHNLPSPVSTSSSSVGVGVDQAHHSQSHLSHAMVGHSQQMNSVDSNGMLVPGGDPQQHPPPPGGAVANGMVDAGTQAATQWGAPPMGFGGASVHRRILVYAPGDLVSLQVIFADS